MASIFTFDPDPPRVASPWATPPVGGSARPNTPQTIANSIQTKLGTRGSKNAVGSDVQGLPIDYSKITRLEAEPQDGPTEYKLHLLLRRRRSFTRLSTHKETSRPVTSNVGSLPGSIGRSMSESGLPTSVLPPLASNHSKQHRLEQLTTQLLWRLQQSCSYHASSSTIPVLPHLPDDARLKTPDEPHRLLPGLEESKGALYEIGVADDGTIVGLAEDEMEESLTNLRAMAASLGCGVEVLRMVPVGECEWLEDADLPQKKMRKSKLVVAEALVRPDQHLVQHAQHAGESTSIIPLAQDQSDDHGGTGTHGTTEQLRVSVTGATLSGKSSLLGTLSTATLDNGRGKSRLSLLKHRHEIASGMTSSVTQELIGYLDAAGHDGEVEGRVVSYDSRDVSSWIDIHAAVEVAERGRLVLLSDSAGHPRYRRTTVRGIVGWQPHWTLLCVPADDANESTAKTSGLPTSQDISSATATGFGLSQAHIQLCLTLELPLVIVITKYDLATKLGLRQTLSKVLSTLKEAGRTPHIISDQGHSAQQNDLHTISKAALDNVKTVVQQLEISPLSAVPILLTSAVKGTGINNLHALLRQLPMPDLLDDSPTETSTSRLFHIEDVYSAGMRSPSEPFAIIGGYLRRGTLKIGDELFLGPYPIDLVSDDSDSGTGQHDRRKPVVPTSRSFPGALNTTHAKSSSLRGRHAEWRRVRLVSLRNLRLPVRALYAGQVGTMGVSPVDTPIMSPSIDRIRKGMVLANREAKAFKVIHVRFEGTQARNVKDLSVGSAVLLYIASVRASSKVIAIAADPSTPIDECKGAEDNDDADAFGFGFDDEVEHVEDEGRASTTPIVATFQFIASREFVEMGAKVLVMPGGAQGLSGTSGKDVAGLEGVVGRVIEEV